MVKKIRRCSTIWNKAGKKKQESLIFNAFPSSSDISATVDVLVGTKWKTLAYSEKLILCKEIKKNMRRR